MIQYLNDYEALPHVQVRVVRASLDTRCGDARRR
jgi:hypothetical protein